MHKRSTFENVCTGIITGVCVAAILAAYRKELTAMGMEWYAAYQSRKQDALSRMWNHEP